MKPIKLKDNVWWVGGIDWDLRNFHGYLTQRGSTYNAYLILDEKITLVDTVKYYLFPELLKRISTLVDPAKIDYVIANHVEMDHSGSLPDIMKYCPNATIFASPKGVEGLKKHYTGNWDYREVKSGDSISLGKRTLSFVQTPMVHWPDNMVTYCPEDKILFSNDAFGQHIASSERFDDEFPWHITREEAAKYYANIVLPYSSQVQKALQALDGLPIDIIAPSHGIIWRSKISDILAEYVKWSGNQVEEKALLIYDTMWKSTEKIAYSIADGFENLGIHVRMCDLKVNHISDIMTEILTAKYICVGSPTINNGILPTVAAFLTYMKGLAPKKRVGMAFGSYGWGGQSVGILHDTLQECGFEMLERIRLQYIPTPEQLQEVEKQVENEIRNLRERA